MPSQKQIEANRHNAQKSTGPKTPEGRLASSRNALRHGLTAEQVVIEGEDEAGFNEMLQAYQAEFQPATALEQTFVDQIVWAQWRLRRLRQIETGFFELQLFNHDRQFDQDSTPLANHHKLAYVVEHDCMNSNTLLNLSRYETRLERSFYRALHELRSLQATRPTPSSVPNEPNSEKPGNVRAIPQPSPPAATPVVVPIDAARNFQPPSALPNAFETRMARLHPIQLNQCPPIQSAFPLPRTPR